jgi:predicted NAD/FAD-binding protein
MDAQPRLAELQGRDRVWYCGSYFGYGFHEDALASAVAMADRFGVDTGVLREPSQVAEPAGRRHTAAPASTATTAGSSA